MDKIEFIDRTVTKHHPLLTWIVANILATVFIFGCIWMFFDLDLRVAIGLPLVCFATWYLLKGPESKVFVRGQDGGWVTLRKK